MGNKPSSGARALRRAGMRIGAGLVAGCLAVLGVYKLSEPSPPDDADRDAQVRTMHGGELHPLSGQEIARARASALADQPRSPTTSGGPQVAYVGAQRLQVPDGGPRMADVRLYDYRTNEMIVRHVDLASGRVLQTERARGTQPSPGPGELRRALGLILADKHLGPGLRGAYRGAYRGAAGREPRAADLRASARVYRAPRRAEAAEGIARCGDQRCFTMNVALPNGAWPRAGRVVVNMSSQRALLLEP